MLHNFFLKAGFIILLSCVLSSSFAMDNEKYFIIEEIDDNINKNNIPQQKIENKPIPEGYTCRSLGKNPNTDLLKKVEEKELAVFLKENNIYFKTKDKNRKKIFKNSLGSNLFNRIVDTLEKNEDIDKEDATALLQFALSSDYIILKEGQVGYWQSFKKRFSHLLSSLTTTYHTCLKVFKRSDVTSVDELLINDGNKTSLKTLHDFDNTFFDEVKVPRYLVKWMPPWLRKVVKGAFGLGMATYVPIGMTGITNYVIGTFFGYERLGLISNIVSGTVMFLNVDIAFIKGWNLGDLLLEKKRTNFKVATSQELKSEKDFSEARIFPTSKLLEGLQVCGAVLEAAVPTAVAVYIYDGVPSWQIPIAIAFMAYYGLDYGKKCIKESNNWHNDKYNISTPDNRRMRQELCASLNHMKSIIENDKLKYFIQLPHEISNEKEMLLKNSNEKAQSKKEINLSSKENDLFFKVKNQSEKKIESSSHEKDGKLKKATHERILKAVREKEKITKKDEKELLNYLISHEYIKKSGEFTTQAYVATEILTKKFGHHKDEQALDHEELASPSSLLFLKMQTSINELDKSEIGSYKRAFNRVLASALIEKEEEEYDIASKVIAGANIYAGFLMDQKAAYIFLKLFGVGEVPGTIISYIMGGVAAFRLIPETFIYKSTLRKWSKPLTFEPIDHKGWRIFFGVKSFLYSLSSSSVVLVLGSWAFDLITMPTPTTASSIHLLKHAAILIPMSLTRSMLIFGDVSSTYNETITALSTRSETPANTLMKQETKLYKLNEDLQSEIRFNLMDKTVTQMHNEYFGSL